MTVDNTSSRTQEETDAPLGWVTEITGFNTHNGISLSGITADINNFTLFPSLTGEIIDGGDGIRLTYVGREGTDDQAIIDVYGPDGNGQLYGEFSITAVPIPAAVWLFGSGLPGLSGIARRKKA